VNAGLSWLTVLYDADCPICRRSRDWLAGQAQLVPLVFVPAASAQARAAFPGLDHEGTLRKITVIGDNGSVYTGDRAWLVCLWALRAWRSAAIRFSRPGNRGYVRAAASAADRLRTMTRTPDHYGETCEGARPDQCG
jgi:predicted DCC family thiol-disulfide oxidoreductase YuxK